MLIGYGMLISTQELQCHVTICPTSSDSQCPVTSQYSSTASKDNPMHLYVWQNPSTSTTRNASCYWPMYMYNPICSCMYKYAHSIVQKKSNHKRSMNTATLQLYMQLGDNRYFNLRWWSLPSCNVHTCIHVLCNEHMDDIHNVSLHTLTYIHT